MRRINAWLFMTLDNIIEAPENWVIADDDMFGAVEADYATSDTLLLGRRTYETFAASWPQRGSEVPNADWMNNTRKYVASTTLESLEWNNSTVIEGDVAEAVARLKQEDGKAILAKRQWRARPDSDAQPPSRRASALCAPGRRGGPGAGCSTTRAVGAVRPVGEGDHPIVVSVRVDEREHDGIEPGDELVAVRGRR